jgi:hypothetical protein
MMQREMRSVEDAQREMGVSLEDAERDENFERMMKQREMELCLEDAERDGSLERMMMHREMEA